VSGCGSVPVVVASSWVVASSMRLGVKTWLAILASSKADSCRRPNEAMATAAIEPQVWSYC
jgi:hypothetical protein